MNVVIEKATPADAEALLAYLKQIGGESDNLTFGSEGVPFSVEAEAEYLLQREQSTDGIVLVAKENGMIIGTASLDRLPRRMRHRGELGISVLKAYQNRGIGRRLIAEILSYARDNEFSVIDLQVRCDNSAAVHLYETMGFEICGVHPAFFQIGEETVPFYMMYRNIP